MTNLDINDEIYFISPWHGSKIETAVDIWLKEPTMKPVPAAGRLMHFMVNDKINYFNLIGPECRIPLQDIRQNIMDELYDIYFL